MELKRDPISGQHAVTARFKPRGLLGILYWYSVLPLHSIVFRGMLKGLRKAAEEQFAAQVK